MICFFAELFAFALPIIATASGETRRTFTSRTHKVGVAPPVAHIFAPASPSGYSNQIRAHAG